METYSWQLDSPVSAIVFDCDGTLSLLEGINELARINQVEKPVELLTNEAMNKIGMTPSIYKKRLDLVVPHYNQVLALGDAYFKQHVPDAYDVIQIFHLLNKSVYVISAGLYPAVELFGKLLNIPSQRIYAVDVKFDEAGNYIDYDHSSPLIYNDGKLKIVEKLKEKHKSIIHIGDGLNDYVTHDIVTRFIGFGGAFYRKNVAELCQFYINSPSLAPLLPLCLTNAEIEKLASDETSIYKKGVKAITDGHVKNPKIHNTFTLR